MPVSDTREHRKFVYGMCREALKKSATMDQVSYALELVSSLNGHKALGFKTRLQLKSEGLPIGWKEI
tara:strand:+ start:526 stop:726 length:201 start_codon:yes stop_codon:yes gene_type:complete